MSEAYLSGDLNNLLDTVCGRVTATAHLRSRDRTRPSSALSMVDPVRDPGWPGPYCRGIDTNCPGDEQDAVTQPGK